MNNLFLTAFTNALRVKCMKFSFLAILLTFNVILNCNAQSKTCSIDTLYTIPSFLTDTTDIGIVCHGFFIEGRADDYCKPISNEKDSLGSVIHIWSNYQNPTVSSPCESIDTFFIGSLVKGNYIVLYDLCDGKKSNYDRDTLLLKVAGTVSVMNKFQPRIFILKVLHDGSLSLTFQYNQSAMINVSLFDVLGRTYWTQSRAFSIGEELQIDRAEILSGMYFVKVETPTGLKQVFKGFRN